MVKGNALAGKLAVTHTLSSDLLQDLKRLGFTEYDARVYVPLLRQSTAPAYEIAQAASVQRPHTYHALEALANSCSGRHVMKHAYRSVALSPPKFIETISGSTNRSD